jgi:hypothetical protein
LGYGVFVKRHDWKKFQDALNSLTSERLQAAIDAVINHRPITDATINMVLRDLRSVGAYEPHSYTQELTIRAEIKGATVRLGMAAWWLTANPSDLRNPFPLVLVLAGLEFSHESTPRLSEAIRRVAATSNPAAVADDLFHCVCKYPLDGWSRNREVHNRASINRRL